MNAVTPALPSAAPATPCAPCAAGPAADGDSGFADALQQARQTARTRDAKQERAAADKREPARAQDGPARADTAATADAEASPAKAAGADDTPAADTGTPLPPWLEQVLARSHPAPQTSSAVPQASAAELASLLTPPPARADHDTTPALAADEGVAALCAPTSTAARASQLQASEQTPADLPGQAPQALRPAGADAAAAAAPPLQALTTPAGSFNLPAAGTPEAVDRPVATPVHSPGFAPALGAQLSLLVKQGVTEARLHLNPAEMGPITVQIQMDGSTARVEMAAEHAVTRQLLEQAMPVLAGALREDGLTLTGGGVFEQARDSPPGDEGPGRPRAAGGATAEESPDPAATARPAAAPRGMVDLYA